MVEFLPLPPSLKAVQGGQFCLGKGGNLKPLEGRANVDVPPHYSHLFSLSVYFVRRKHTLSLCDICKKERGYS